MSVARPVAGLVTVIGVSTCGASGAGTGAGAAGVDLRTVLSIACCIRLGARRKVRQNPNREGRGGRGREGREMREYDKEGHLKFRTKLESSVAMAARRESVSARMACEIPRRVVMSPLQIR